MTPMMVNAIILAKMALKDGIVVDSERDFLEEMCEALVGISIDALLETAEAQDLDALLPKVNRYEDRFFIALRAYVMAHVDEAFDIQEEAFFDKLIDVFAIPEDDRALIVRTEQSMKAADPGDPEPRVYELYRSSSFFREEEEAR